MTSTNARFTLCGIDLNVEITPLPNLNIVVETSLTNQPIFVVPFKFFNNFFLLRESLLLILFIEF